MRSALRDDLRETLLGVLVTDRQQPEAEARALVEEVARRYLTVEDVGGPHFELLNVSIAWAALCADVAAGDIASPDDDVGGRILLGGLRWLHRMAPYALARSPAGGGATGEADHVEAAACLAFVRLDAVPLPSDPLGALHDGVGAALARHALGPVDRARVAAARERLERLRAVETRRGWVGLREAIRFQVPEE